jgi:hypothetical protein
VYIKTLFFGSAKNKVYKGSFVNPPQRSTTVGAFLFLNFMKYALIVLSVIFVFYLESGIKFELFDKFYRRNLVDDPRFDIIILYMNNLSFNSFFFGFPKDMLTKFFASGNLHNSFLVMHYRFGVFALLIFLIFSYRLIYLLKYKKYGAFILVFSIIVRSLTDTILLVFYFDFIFIFILFSDDQKRFIDV